MIGQSWCTVEALHAYGVSCAVSSDMIAGLMQVCNDCVVHNDCA